MSRDPSPGSGGLPPAHSLPAVIDPNLSDPFLFGPPDSDPWLEGEALSEGAGRRILIVDDDALLVQRMCALLDQEFEVQGVCTPAEALDRFRAGERYAVVVSDQDMPGMDGTTLLREIQALAPETVRVLFTGLYDMEMASRALSEGRIFRFLMKPCSVDDLATVLEAAVLRHRRKTTWSQAKERMRFCNDSMQGFTKVLEQRLDQAHYSVVFALARLAEERDNCTGHHLERVSAFCRVLSEGLRDAGHYTDELTDTFIRDIERSAPLHDIGKVGIPDSVLLKPGKLTEAEWCIMRRHPEIGAETMNAIIATSPGASFLTMGRDVALCHHENWDGSGYGQGLVGEAIPLSARILKAADCYDALTTWRPYKEPWSHERAVAHVLGEAGREFDPKVATILQASERKFDHLRCALSDATPIA